MSTEYQNDIPQSSACAAYYGVSMNPEKRADRERSDYSETLAADYESLRQQAEKGKTLDLLDAEFAQYRAGYRKRTLAYLHSSSRCVSWFIAGPSNFPAARMNKRADIAHKRLNELLEFRGRALASIRRKLRPDLAPIYASDSDAIERLQQDLTERETRQARMVAVNKTIRANLKQGKQAQVQALLELGYSMGGVERLLTPDCFGGIGFAHFELSNNNASIRRIKARIEQITQLQNTPQSEVEGVNARLEDCPQDNRIRLFFPGKPSEDVRSKLKSRGFRWSPTIGAWQAYRNAWAMQTAKEVAGIGQPVAA